MIDPYDTKPKPCPKCKTIPTGTDLYFRNMSPNLDTSGGLEVWIQCPGCNTQSPRSIIPISMYTIIDDVNDSGWVAAVEAWNGLEDK